MQNVQTTSYRKTAHKKFDVIMKSFKMTISANKTRVIILFRSNLVISQKLKFKTNAFHNELESVWTNFSRLGGAKALRAKP